MKCKIHPYEPGAGVCASCLRDRLLALLAAQTHDPSQDHRRKSGRLRPPLLFPRSVSPYVSHRRSVDSSSADSDPRARFHRTPQPASVRSGRSRFSDLSSLFRHSRSDDPDDPKPSGSRSWLASLIRGGRKRRKKKKPPVLVEGRGMSPARGAVGDDFASESGDETDTSAGWQRPTPARRVGVGGAGYRVHGGGFSGFSACLSPLVWPRSTGRRSQPSEVGFSGELRGTANRHVSAAVSREGLPQLGPNRSRKLADPGRFR